MTIGERERVPFVRHDYFIEEWEAVGRILVKGFTSVDYFPTFLSKAVVCFCLFGTEVTEDIFLSSFKQYLSQIEEELIESVIDAIKDNSAILEPVQIYWGERAAK